jgi:hypothetical protein
VLTLAQIASLSGGASVQSVVTQTGGFAVNYDFEGDSGTTITDKFTLDGSQNGIAHRQASVDTNPANARLGNASGNLAVATPPHTFSQISTGIDHTDLGSAFTMSAVINVEGDGYVSGKQTRLFSNLVASSGLPFLVFDFEPDASSNGFSCRLILPGGTNVSTNQPFSYGDNHTLTATYDGSGTTGIAKIYIDGVEVFSGATATSGDVDLGDYGLMVGEDQNGIANEQFVGTMDDVLILGEALSAADVMLLHTDGAAAIVPEPGIFALLAAGLMMMLIVRRKR